MTTCKCGKPVSVIELRVVQRCAAGHFISSDVAPAILKEGVPEKATSGQIRAVHAKCTAVDNLLEQRVGTKKAQLLASVELESASDLTSATATKLLDELEFQLETLAA